MSLAHAPKTTCPRCLELRPSEIHTCSPTPRWLALEARIAELEAEVEYLRNNHKESCLWPSTIIESDQKMADGRPRKIAAVPNWCIHKIETYARKKK